jgi:hypothetical protein
LTLLIKKMLSIHYDVFMAKNTVDGTIQVSPVINSPYYALKSPFDQPYLTVPDNEAVCWQWWLSVLHLRNEAEQLQEIQTWAASNVMVIHPVLKNTVLKDNSLHIQYLKTLFSSLRCGIERNELLAKLYGKFTGAEWAEDIIGFLRHPLQLGKPLLTCKITVTHGTFQSLFPPYNAERKRKVDLTTWKPKNPMDFSILLHLLVTLSNGESYKMYFPICSLNRWQAAIKQYFENNPQVTLSPDVVIGVTNHSKAYRFESILKDLMFLEANTIGSSVSEILLKLSIWRNFPERQAHLKQVLTGNQVELVFSGNVICEDTI